MKQLNLLTGKTKEETAIEFIRKHEPPEGYFLGFSGGKDSVVVYELAKRSKVVFFPYYEATGIDPPELMKFIKKEYPEVKWLRPKRSFFGEMVDRGFPTKFSRWC